MSEPSEKLRKLRYKVLEEKWDREQHGGFSDHYMKAVFKTLRKNSDDLWDFIQFEFNPMIADMYCRSHLRCYRERLTHACMMLDNFVKDVAKTTGGTWLGMNETMPFKHYQPNLEAELDPNECTIGLTETAMLKSIHDCQKRIIFLQEVLEGWRMQVERCVCCSYHGNMFAKQQVRLLKAFREILLRPMRKCTRPLTANGLAAARRENDKML